MLHRLEDFPNGVEFAADLCIVGAGAAGITLAREFAGNRVRVVVLESGGLAPDDISRSLNAGRNLGLPYYPLDACRERCLGGTTAMWSGRCVPLDPIDFSVRAWMPFSGWPINRADLEPYYRRAQSVCGVGEYRYDDTLWQDLGIEPPAFDPAVLNVRFWRIAPERFGRRYRKELQDAPNISVVLGATVTNVGLAVDAASVDRLHLAGKGGRSAIIRARRYVLAAGGIENARLLLSSDDVQTCGVGNWHGLVGRFFMEHPKCRVARVEARAPYQLLETFRKHFPLGLPQLCPAILATPEAQRRHAILNSCLAFYFHSSPGMNQAARELRLSLRGRRLPPHAFAKLRSVAPALGELPSNLWRRFVRRRALIVRPKEIYLLVRGEQAPNPDSRVVLSTERDALGQRRADLHWQLSAVDKTTVRVLTELAAMEFSRLGLGQVEPEKWLYDQTPDWPTRISADDKHQNVIGGNHHIGTTRMAGDLSHGVVDRDGAVFGIANLFIAGSSIFPTSGWANPTLTIVALTLRLADRIKADLAQANERCFQAA